MAALSVLVPFPVFSDRDGQPVDSGSIYIGIANQNPVTNPIQVYYDAELSISASQPLITSGGYFYRNGTPTNVYVDDYAYSITVNDSKNTLIYTNPMVLNNALPLVTLAELPDVPPSAGSVAFVTDVGREGQFICRAGNPPSDPLQGIYVDSNTVGFYWERVWDGINAIPEWFGAISNSNSGTIPADNVSALEACVLLCPVTNLAPEDYWINSVWKIDTEYRTVRGAVLSNGYDTGTGTRVLCTDAASNVIQVGPDSAPATTSDYYRNITVENLNARWGVSLTPPNSGSESSAVKAWLVNYVLNCQIRNCTAWEPIIGFYLYGCVYTKFDDCAVFRSNTYGGANDFFRGIWAQGAPPILAGGNPSIYINRCNVSTGGSPALVSPTGVFMNANFSDIFIDDLETSAVDNGIIVDGTGGASGASKIDLHIRNSVMDQCNGNGIEINALNAMAMVTINGGYIQINDTAATKNGIYIHGSVNSGSVSIGGGIQIISSVGTSNRGIYISQQSNVKVDSTVIIEDFFNPVAIDGGSERCDIRATINNPNTGNGTTAAVFINNAVECYIAPSVDGAASVFGQGAFSTGILLNRATIDPTLFNSTAISGGSANKVVVNSVAITTPDYYTTAGVAGTAGAGIFVTGITA